MATQHFRRWTFNPIQTVDDALVLVAHDGLQQVTLQARDVRWQGQHLVGHLTMARDDEEQPQVLPTFSFTDLQHRNVVLTLIGREFWSTALNRFCTEVLQRQDNRLQAVRLVDVPYEEILEEHWRVDPLPPVILDDLTVWFGDGGVGKSYLALYAAGSLAAQGFRVLYADWEMSKGRHGHRLKQLFGFGPGEVPDVLYVDCDTPLVQATPDLLRLIARYRVDYVIVDSVARACHGDAERNEIATSYLNAAKALGVGSLHIAHVTKSTAQTAEKPFGSVFWHNGARETWSIQHAPEYNRDGAVGLLMQQRKSNFSAPNTTLYTLQLTAEAGRMFILPVTGEVVSESQLGSARERVRQALVTGPLTRDELRARCAAVRPDAFRQALHREREAGGIVDLGDGLLALNETPGT